MAMTLTQFLMDNDVTTITEEVVVSRRIKDDQGNLLKFKIKPFFACFFHEFFHFSMKLFIARVHGN